MAAPKVNWALLKDLRDVFLNESFSSYSYWDSDEVLEHYDLTFAQRIGWKWEAVLKEFFNVGAQILNEPVTLIDWGCGTAIATRTFLKSIDPSLIKEVFLWDKSQRSRNFSQMKLQSEFSIKHVSTSNIPDSLSHYILLISHVLNELDSQSELELKALMKRAKMILWVEPGTPQASSRLIQYREVLKEEFQVLAPCPHQSTCGLLRKPSSDWCHFFASTPNSVFRNPFWSEFSKQLGIDLRSLPTSFLVLLRIGAPLTDKASKRVLGRARHFKGYSTALICSEKGVNEEKILKRDNKQLIESLKENPFTFWLP